MNERQVILILGMHRSGTSLLARLINLLGATAPLTRMPATTENPSGYWESVPVTRFNNRLLASAGSDWKDDTPLPTSWFNDPARTEDIGEAIRILKEEFGEAPLFVLKCPRICRLLPFWERVFAEAGIRPKAIILTRDPVEVANSLAARAAIPAFAPAAIRSAASSALLWLRYTLDAERYSRNIPRYFVDHSAILKDWKTALQPVREGFMSGLPTQEDADLAEIEALFDPRMRRARTAADPNVKDDPDTDRLLHPLQMLREKLNSADPDIQDTCDVWHDRLETIHQSYAPVRSAKGGTFEEDAWSKAMLQALHTLFLADGMTVDGQKRKGNILFLSGRIQSIGHVLRVAQPSAVLEAAGWSTRILATDDPEVDGAIGAADMVVVFRSVWNPALERIKEKCVSGGIRMVYDIDDLVFLPGIIHPEDIDAEKLGAWSRDSMAYQQALTASDAAILTTGTLAAYAAVHCRQVHELPNFIGTSLADHATAALTLPRPSDADGRLRIGFMSGTPTHDRDFALVVPALAGVLANRKDTVLVVTGYVDLGLYDELLPFRDRIEVRPRVPLNDLFAEMTRLDIHLSPLEMDYPLCSCKSAIRVNFAGAVGVPSVASSTEPHSRAILDGISGYLAWNAAHWSASLYHLLDDPDSRRSMGLAAQIHTLAQYGPQMGGMLTRAVYGSLCRKKDTAQHDTFPSSDQDTENGHPP